MPKEKSGRSTLLKRWIIGDPSLTTDGRIIYCNCCIQEVSFTKLIKLWDERLETGLLKFSSKIN